jgi:thioredoxin reductase (NADPH)
LTKTDALVIGAGPAGLFAVFQLGHLGIKAHVVDTLHAVGGQCTELYPDKPIYDIPAYKSITGQELGDRLMEQIAHFSPKFHLGRKVTRVQPSEAGFIVQTDRGDEFRSKVIVIAAGGGAFTPRRPAIPEIEEYEGKSVFYSVPEREKFRKKALVIAGGGDAAVDWANDFSEIASAVTIIHRRDKFRAAPASVAKMRKLAEEGRIKIVIGQVKELHGENGRLEKITTQDGADITCEALLPFFGLAAELGPIANWGLNLNENRIEVDTEKFETSQPGIFAIGDINYYPGKLKLILSGFHEAALMAQAAYRRIHPDKEPAFQYSTSQYNH